MIIKLYQSRQGGLSWGLRKTIRMICRIERKGYGVFLDSPEGYKYGNLFSNFTRPYPEEACEGVVRRRREIKDLIEIEKKTISEQDVVRKYFHPVGRLATEIGRLTSRLLGDAISVHIRRGDSYKRAVFLPCCLIARQISGLKKGEPVFIASDSQMVIYRMRQVMPDKVISSGAIRYDASNVANRGLHFLKKVCSGDEHAFGMLLDLFVLSSTPTLLHTTSSVKKACKLLNPSQELVPIRAFSSDKEKVLAEEARRLQSRIIRALYCARKEGKIGLVSIEETIDNCRSIGELADRLRLMKDIIDRLRREDRDDWSSLL
jgi:hypothetical protein